jgi:hypothetical protein
MREIRPMVALLALCACGCSGSSSPTTTSAPHPAVFTGRARSCPRPATYTPSVSPLHAAAGATVTLSGTLPLYGESGKLDTASPTTRMVVWWNLDPNDWVTAVGTSAKPAPAIQNRPVVHVLSTHVPVPNPCRYHLTFVAPDVHPGAYQVTTLYFGGGGGTTLPSATVNLTRSKG